MAPTGPYPLFRRNGIDTAAEAFLASNKPMPDRLKELCSTVLQPTTFMDNNDENDDPCNIYWGASDPIESRRISLTAAIWASPAANGLDDEFEQLLSESLRQHLEHGEQELPLQEEEAWFTYLQRLKWIDRGGFVAPILADVLHSALSTHVRETIVDEFDRDDFHQELEQWKDSTLLPWTCALVGPHEELQQHWTTWLDLLVPHCIVQCRLTQLFDILRDYPDSQPAIQELGVLLRKTQLHSEFLSSLITSLCQRLLHPGASADLYQELRKHGPLEDSNNNNEDEEEDDEPPGMDWMPPPPLREERVTFFEGKSRKLDILSILVSIYGSKELFVDEYRVMLADKLLSNLDYNTDAQVHTLELLKLRFGDASMRQCEIMIKDTDDSKRIVTNIQSTLKSKGKNSVVDAAIISHIFWPSILQQEPMQHHPRIQAELDAFSAEYGQLKNPRRLVWYDQLGTVELDLEVWEGGELRTKQVTCLPLMATLISHFEDKAVWTAEELCNIIGIPETLVQKRMQFWLNHRVVVLKSNAYHLASSQQWSEDTMLMANQDEDPESAIGGNDEAEQDDVLTSYVIGMLKRYKELPLSRIHDMLKLFANGSDHAYNKTPRQLTALLQKLCRDERLECGPTGMYKLMEK
ncbi:Anaphase promoting complex (APC) subunit 2 [Fragilaria crotonensis]|nr:Anaphase promoting complex (APC) subunit 2 [Fragilaria crotonensis]